MCVCVMVGSSVCVGSSVYVWIAVCVCVGSSVCVYR